MRAVSLLTLAAVAIGVPVLGSACKKRPVTAATAESCNAILASAGSVVAEAQRRANESTSCTADGECVDSPVPTCLYSGCGGYGVPQSAVRSFSATVASVENDACRRWNEGECAKIAPRPMASCAPVRPRCFEHHCRMSSPILLAADECEALYSAARKSADEALARADTRCARDEDCTQLDARPSCFTGCGGYAVARRGAEATKEAMGAIDRTSCEPWVKGGCPATTPRPVPSCAPLVVVCKGGSCVHTMPSR
jgi:hypothetical protein